MYGIASWYGDEFAGKKTSSGEIFDPNKYTAAHKTLPFGTLIEVENLDNGNKVNLIINDRGPFVDNRIIDVSKRAAKDLGFLSKGTAYVRITILKLGNNDEYIKNVKLLESSSVSEPTSNILNIVPQSSFSSISSAAFSSTSSQISIEKPILPPEQKQVIVITTNGTNFIQTNIGVFTNIVTQFQTNLVYYTNQITNTNLIIITNYITLPPYEEKIVESNILAKDNIILPVENENDFIIDEPIVSSSSSLSSYEISSQSKSSQFSEKNDEFNEYFLDEDYSYSNINQISNFISNEKLKEIEKKSLNQELYKELGSFEQLSNSNYVKFSEDNTNLLKNIIKPQDKIIFLSNNYLKIIGEKLKEESNRKIPVFSSEKILLDTNDFILIPTDTTKEISNKISDNIKESIVTNEIALDKKENLKFEGYYYSIQVGAFTKQNNAYMLYEKLRNDGFPVFMTETYINNKILIRIRVGQFETIDEANSFLIKLKKYKLETMIVKISIK